MAGSRGGPATTEHEQRRALETAREYASPARPVGGGDGRERGRLVAAAWAIGAVAVVALGVAGQLGDETVAGPSASTTAPRAGAATSAPSSAVPIVALSEPAPPPSTVTGIPLWVRGRAAKPVAQILLVLRSDGTEVARQSTTPGRSGRFAAVFTLQPPRPRMDLTVVAIALNGGAETLGQAEQPVRVAPLDRVAAVPSPRPSLGEDGVLGSRGVDVSALVPAGDSAGVAPVATDWPWPRPGSLAEQAYR
jgi:hypothetical protein